MDRAAALIRAGRPVAVPTETVYGLAARADDPAAVAAIYEAKGRPSFNPLIVHVFSQEQAERIAIFDDVARRLAARFWPGPLTLVLPLRAKSGIASLATAGLDTIALRMPAHPVMRALLETTGLPLAAPSANASGSISPTRAEHVRASLGDKVAMVLDAGPTAHGLESTIVRVKDGETQILRPGPITAEEIAEVDSARKPGVETIAAISKGDSSTDAIVIAPGQLESHYAPSKPLRLNATDSRDAEYLIGFGPVGGKASLSPKGDLAEAAARLFDLLHAADAASEPAIAVAPIPDQGLGVAINDRLRRAAAPRTPF